MNDHVRSTTVSFKGDRNRNTTVRPPFQGKGGNNRPPRPAAPNPGHDHERRLQRWRDTQAMVAIDQQVGYIVSFDAYTISVIPVDRLIERLGNNFLVDERGHPIVNKEMLEWAEDLVCVLFKSAIERIAPSAYIAPNPDEPVDQQAA